MVSVVGVWHFRESSCRLFLIKKIVSKQEGNTRLYRSKKNFFWSGSSDGLPSTRRGKPDRLIQGQGNDCRNNQAKRLHQKASFVSSTGNTSASLAAYRIGGGNNGVSADPQRKCCRRKISQALAYGTKTLIVNGDFDDCMRLIFEAQEKLQAYPLNSINPFRLEGKRQLFGNAAAA